MVPWGTLFPFWEKRGKFKCMLIAKKSIKDEGILICPEFRSVSITLHTFTKQNL
jgi:hypothetical protein